MVIEPDRIRAWLLEWQQGTMTASGVHAAAEALWEAGDEWPEYSRNDPRSIWLEALSQLDMMNQQLITVEDVPALLAFLDTPSGKEEQAWIAWERYWASVDFRTREKQLRGVPPYIVT